MKGQNTNNKLNNEQKIDQRETIASIFEICQSGNTEDLRTWIENHTSANINQKEKSGITPLHYASEEGHVEMAKLLIDNGANIHEKDSFNGYTPLHYASEEGHVEMAKLLIDNGANIHEKDYDENTPLHYASQIGDVEMTKLLIDKGADIEYKGKELVYIWARNRNLEFVKYLVEYKCSVDIRNEQLELLTEPIKDYISGYKKHLEAGSLHRTKIFSLFGQFSLFSFATITPPNIGFVNLVRTCKYPAYYWGTYSEFCSEMICLVLLFLSVIPSQFVPEEQVKTDFVKWKEISSVMHGMGMLMEITYRHLMNVRRIKGRETSNTRSLCDSEFATTAIEDIYGKRICNILYQEK